MSVKEMGKALDEFLHSLWRRMGDLKRLLQLLKPRTMSSNKEFRGNDTTKIKKLQK